MGTICDHTIKYTQRSNSIPCCVHDVLIETISMYNQTLLADFGTSTTAQCVSAGPVKLYASCL